MLFIHVQIIGFGVVSLATASMPRSASQWMTISASPTSAAR